MTHVATPAILGTRTITLVLFAIVIVMAQSRITNAQWSTADGGGHIHSTNSGNVGVGTDTPAHKLDVWGNAQWVARFKKTDATNGGIIIDSATGYNPNILLSAGGTAKWFMLSNAANSDALQFWEHTGNGPLFTLTQAGSVGIGTPSPTSNLEVQGADGPLTLSQSGVTAKVTLQAALGTEMHLSANAKYSSSNWNRYDTSLPSWNIFGSPASDFAGIRRAAAASGAITWIDFFRITNAGNVGISTTSPLQKLQVGGNTSTSTATPDAISLGGTYSSSARTNAKLRLYDDSNPIYVYGLGVSYNQFDFMVPATAHYVWSAGGVEKMRLESDGTVTIAGSIAAKYQDVAEWVESSQHLAPGTVVVLDQNRSNQVVASFKAYDTGVAGVISSQPGITLGEKSESKVLVATTGRVRIKVDASSGPIKVGDLLVTSDIPGVAKKSEPLSLGGVEIHRPGTLIGKALEPLAKGTGEILVLLSLQ